MLTKEEIDKMLDDQAEVVRLHQAYKEYRAGLRKPTKPLLEQCVNFLEVENSATINHFKEVMRSDFHYYDTTCKQLRAHYECNLKLMKDRSDAEIGMLRAIIIINFFAWLVVVCLQH